MLSFFREIAKFKIARKLFLPAVSRYLDRVKLKKFPQRIRKESEARFLICVDELSFDRSFTTG